MDQKNQEQRKVQQTRKGAKEIKSSERAVEDGKRNKQRNEGII